MAVVLYEARAARQIEHLPASVQRRVAGVILRLGRWPHVSGVKPLRGNLAGRFRIRTGDYRVQFCVVGDEIIIERVGHRDGFYEG